MQTDRHAICQHYHLYASAVRKRAQCGLSSCRHAHTEGKRKYRASPERSFTGHPYLSVGMLYSKFVGSAMNVREATLTMVRPSLKEVLPLRVKGFSSSVPQAWLVYPCKTK